MWYFTELHREVSEMHGGKNFNAKEAAIFYIISKQMNSRSLNIKVFALIFLSFIIPLNLYSSNWATPGDTSFIELRGSVKDKDTKEPIVFASIYLVGTNIGTISNLDGQFAIKVPQSRMTGKIGVSCLGYKNVELPIASFQKNRNEIRLEITRYYIRELTIRSVDPLELIRTARTKIPENYGDSPAMLTAFYRETIRQNRNYVAISEAVFDVYKSPYSRFIDYDRVKIFKGRKSQDVAKMDTVLFRLQGGPYYLYMLDIVKNPDELISEENFNFYDYTYSGMETVENRDAYVINFDQKKGISMALYKGKIYVDVNTQAISGIDFQLSPYGLEFAPVEMIKKKPIGMKIEIPGASYVVKYRVIDDRWFLSYARTEAHFRCKWNRKLFRSNYTTISEMAITDIDTNPDNIVKYKLKESSKSTDVFSDQVSDFEDTEFWGDYNIIRPEVSIEEATRKLAKKLKRN
jgi:hypothetical protein